MDLGAGLPASGEIAMEVVAFVESFLDAPRFRHAASIPLALGDGGRIAILPALHLNRLRA